MPKKLARQAPLYQKVPEDDGRSWLTSGLTIDGHEDPEAAQRRAESRARVAAECASGWPARIDRRRESRGRLSREQDRHIQGAGKAGRAAMMRAGYSPTVVFESRNREQQGAGQ